MCAWLSTTPSSRRGSNGRRALSSWVSARRPWNSPASSRKRAPAASSRCIEPVTCPAAPQKVRRMPVTYLSRLKGERSEVPRAEQPVAGIAKAGQDVAVLVELAVERGGEDMHLGMRLEHQPHPLGGGHDREEPDPPRSRAPERPDCGHRRAPGGEHRVEQVEV